MKIDKFEFKQVINRAKSLKYLYEYTDKSRLSETEKEEIEMLIEQDIYHQLLQHSKKTLFGDKINLNDQFQKKYRMLKSYLETLDNDYY